MQLDEIGPWSEIKLEIIRSYAKEYSKVLKNFPRLRYYYIDRYAGAGIHRRKKTGEYIMGSPLIVLEVMPKFEHYYFVDTDETKIEFLRSQIGERKDVTILHGDCNDILPKEVFPQVKYADYKRALCFLDPYALHLDWDLVLMAGRMRSVEVFINFPVLDMNRNVLWQKSESVGDAQVARMDRFWGDHSWYESAYKEDLDLFGESRSVKTGIGPLVSAYRQRLADMAGFKYVPKPLPMRSGTGAILYYIYFASQNETANTIVTYILEKHR